MTDFDNATVAPTAPMEQLVHSGMYFFDFQDAEALLTRCKVVQVHCLRGTARLDYRTCKRVDG
jgi:hypothetical protein